jgi:hypothetical protein
MRIRGTLIALSLLAWSGPARAEEPAPATVAATGSAAAPRRPFLLGASFLPMALGQYTFSDSFTSTTTQDAYFAYGVGLSGSYELLRGLLVGLAPQAIFNVQAKPSDAAYAKAMTELDFMVRVAYAHHVVDTIAVYAEALPGYSLIIPADNAAVSKGMVLGFSVGAAVDLIDRAFVNIGAGYQVGFQSQTQGIHHPELRTSYVRVAIGAGMKF